MKHNTRKRLPSRPGRKTPTEESPIRNPPHKKIALTLSIAVLLPVFLSSCIVVYRDFPTAMIGKPPESKSYDLLSYHINPFPFPNEGGKAALHSVFNNETPFANTADVTEMPQKGVFCLVDVEWRSPDMTAVVFHYISLATLTVLPSWSVRESYKVRYYLFIDGKNRKTFEYKITRKTGLWLGLLPVSWLNWFTDTQAEAFEATAYQFFEDAKPILSTLEPHERIID
ncbi:MAG: hypothetical protein HY203_11365 [Nitrospirae bacterium]|nr:hypothetical protein [Nitrospirota bacterium]